MVFMFRRNHIAFYKCLDALHFVPKWTFAKKKYGWDIWVSWLGGCFVWSRLKRTFKDTYGV